MKRAMIFGLILSVLIPASGYAGVTRKVVERSSPLSSGESTILGNPRTVVYIDDQGKEIAKETCDETGRVVKTIGNIPDGIVKEYFESGALLAEYNYKGGKLEGTSKGYYEKGTLRGEWNYKNGKLDGLMKYFYGNGNLNYETNYKDDKRNGISKHYDETGKLIYEFNFKDDEYDGITKSYYENGKLSGEYNYKDGKREGVSKVYHKSGKLKSIETYEKGKMIDKQEYDDKGNLISGTDHSGDE